MGGAAKKVNNETWMWEIFLHIHILSTLGMLLLSNFQQHKESVISILFPSIHKRQNCHSEVTYTFSVSTCVEKFLVRLILHNILMGLLCVMLQSLIHYAPRLTIPLDTDISFLLLSNMMRAWSQKVDRFKPHGFWQCLISIPTSGICGHCHFGWLW
jgi:hypothetical protein